MIDVTWEEYINLIAIFVSYIYRLDRVDDYVTAMNHGLVSHCGSQKGIRLSASFHCCQ